MLSSEKRAQFIFIIIALALAFFLQLAIMKFPPHYLVLFLLTFMILFIAFVKTNLALFILIFTMLLSPEFGLGGIPGRSVVFRFDDFFILMLFFGWLAKMAVNKELGFLKVTPLNKPILAYITVCIISSVFGIMSGTTDMKYSLFYNLKYIEYFLLFFMVSNNITEKRQVKIFIYTLLFVSLIVSIFAAHVSLIQGMRATAPFEGDAGEPNTLAGYLIIMIGLCLGIFLYTNKFKTRLIIGGLGAFMTVPFLYTLSRAGWLGFGVMFLAFLLLTKRNKAFLVLIVFLVLINVPTISKRLPQVVSQRYASTFKGGDTFKIGGRSITIDESASIRLRTWKKSLQMWSERPILGRGVPGGGAVSDVQYTRVLREVGIVGFGAFLWIISGLYRVGWRSYKETDTDPFFQGISLGFVCSLSGLLAMGVAAEFFIIIRIMEPFWFLAAIIVTLPEIKAEEDENLNPEGQLAH